METPTEDGSTVSPPTGKSRIRVLPPDLANQIAAGEVVERPASVVKEMVENAVDAGARRITVSIQEGGLSLIRVMDDGCGMSAEEAVLSLQRHATSKLRSVNDLTSISTLGFRGEALPSIASVSRLSLVTRPAESDVGVKVEVEGGGPPVTSEVGCAPGTVVEVRELFFNVPARRKFMRKPATEAGHVQESVVRLALTHPDVHFVLKSDGKGLLDLPVHPDLEGRIGAALGRRAKGGLYPVRSAPGEIEVQAFLAARVGGLVDCSARVGGCQRAPAETRGSLRPGTGGGLPGAKNRG
jgi:DNA mismatch repair protein MutL